MMRLLHFLARYFCRRHGTSIRFELLFAGKSFSPFDVRLGPLTAFGRAIPKS